MKKQQLNIVVDEHEITVEMLGARLARVIDPGFSLKLSEDDIILLSNNPCESESPPTLIEIVHKRNPVVSKVEFWTEGNRNRMIALSAVMGVEVIDIDDLDENLDRISGTIRIAHAENIDIHAIAEAAGVTAIPTDEDFEDDEDGLDEPEDEGEGVPDFDAYFMKPVNIPFFVWDDGQLRPFDGFCRGDGPITDDESDWNHSIGVFTAEGKYFTVTIDTRVRCAVPQFWVDQKPFHFPIVSFATTGGFVDPATGILMPHAEHAQGVDDESKDADPPQA